MTFYKQTEKTLYKRDQEIPVDLNINQNTKISTMYISFCDRALTNSTLFLC